MSVNIEDLYKSIFKNNAILFGEYELTKGQTVRFYLDLYGMLKDTVLCEKISELGINKFLKNDANFDCLCGVPYAGIPFASLVSIKLDVSLIIEIKEVKMQPRSNIQGVFVDKRKCVLFEEVIASGQSALQTAKNLENVGIQVVSVIVLINLCQGGKENLEKFGYKVFPLINIHEMSTYLYKNNFITEKQYRCIEETVTCQLAINGDAVHVSDASRHRLRYEEHFTYSKCDFASKLFSLMATKRTNVFMELASEDVKDLRVHCDTIGPYIAVLVVRSEEYSDEDLLLLRKLSKLYNFMILDDMRLATDDDEVLLTQYTRSCTYAHLITVHALCADYMLKVISSSFRCSDSDIITGIIILTHSDSPDSLAPRSYSGSAVKIGTKYSNLVAGFVSQTNSNIPLGFIHIMKDTQNLYLSRNCSVDFPLNIMICDCGADAVIIPSVSSSVVAKHLKDVSWRAYCSRITSE